MGDLLYRDQPIIKDPLFVQLVNQKITSLLGPPLYNFQEAIVQHTLYILDELVSYKGRRLYFIIQIYSHVYM